MKLVKMELELKLQMKLVNMDLEVEMKMIAQMQKVFNAILCKMICKYMHIKKETK